MRKSVAIASIALFHFTASVVMIPMANEAFQRWFDTGSSLSRLEWWNLWISRVISFPLVVWTFLLHPARINTAV